MYICMNTMNINKNRYSTQGRDDTRQDKDKDKTIAIHCDSN